MELEQTEPTGMNLMETQPAPWLTAATGGLAALWRFVIRRAGPKRAALSVRETAALGERRFVSVIQFEHLRFLIGSSPSAITLLAQLPDSSGGEPGNKSSGEKN